MIGRGQGLFKKYVTYYTTFNESYNLQTNAAVKLFKTDIGKVKQITLAKEGEWDPSLMDDGTIMFTRWEYVMRFWRPTRNQPLSRLLDSCGRMFRNEILRLAPTRLPRKLPQPNRS